MIYAFESSICLLLFWLFYILFLSGDTHHGRNRLFLLLSVTTSSLIPLMHFSYTTGGHFLSSGGLTGLLLPEALISSSGLSGRSLAGPALILPVTYITGAAVSATFFLAISLRLLWMIIRRGNNEKVVLCDSKRRLCYSAFGHVFISRSVLSDDAERMIAHEKEHVSRLHHFDLMLTGLVCIIQWFNPAAYLLRRSLQTIHEYEADKECINNGEEVASYQQLLVSAVLNTRLTILSNTFSNTSLLKNRIIMMTKKKTAKSASLKMILALPLALIMLFLFSCKERGAVQKEPAPPVLTESETIVYDTVSAGSPSDVFTSAEVMPLFQNDPTGTALMQWIAANVSYPDEAKANGIQGKVLIRFIIDEEGNVTNRAIVGSADPLLDKAAFEVMKKCPKWSVGLQGGKPVSVSYVIPINFRLK